MNYKLNEEKMFADITDGIAIIINSETGIYYGTSPLGTAVLEQLIKGASIESIAAALKGMAGCPEDIERQLIVFADDLTEKGILIKEGASTCEAVISANALVEGWRLDFSEFADAQELLLADPIHEVNEDTGWTPDANSINPDKEDVARREAKMG